MDVVTNNLNPLLVKMVTPSKCIIGYYGLTSSNTKPFKELCECCQYRIGDECVYRKYSVESAQGSYRDSDDKMDMRFIHWCCADCGELVKLDERLSYVSYNLKSRVHICPNCKTTYKLLENPYDSNTLVFAIPLNKREV